MIYEKKGKIKKILAMFAVSAFTVSSLMSSFFCISKVEASISKNLPVSYMSDTFPDSYTPYIKSLKSSHPNWVFKAVYTGLDWNEAVTHESYDVNEGISLVPDSYDAVWKKDGQNYYKDGNFVIASKDAVKYMLDPRGHLNEKEIFQFQTLSYSSSMDSIESIEKVLYGTSMYNRAEYQNQGKMINMGKTYSNIILEAAQTYNVSAIHIASRIKQETSGAITSNRSINGSTVVDGKVPYNYFNIGATPPNAITNGLIYAANKGWTDPDKAIKGGTDILRNSWIKWGQDTTYFQKFDVNNPYGNAVALYAYQYMANIIAPTSESYSRYTAYEKMGMINNTFEFHIPVFNNMPSSPTPYPGESGETYIADNTRIAAYDVAPYMLYIRSGPGTDYSIVAKLNEGDELTRTAKSIHTQWDKVKLDNGIEGYVFRDYTIEVPTNVSVTGISLNNNNLELKVGDTYNLSCEISPSNATNKNVEWSSSNYDVVSVENGKVTAKSKGEATITVKSLDTGVTATCSIKVLNKVTSVSLSNKEINLNKGETHNLTYTILPDDAANKDVEWSSSNPDVVSVENGKITAKNVGNAIITLKAIETGITATCNVTVTSKVENISLEKEEYTVIKDRYLTITPIITPDDATNKKYSITSEDENIVKIEDGKIKGVDIGQANVTFKTKEGEKSVTIKIKVINISDSDCLTFEDSLRVDEKNNQVSKIEPDTKTSDLSSKISYNKDKYDIVIKNIKGEEISDSSLVGTGTTINMITKDSKDIVQTYTVVIYGDISGDGKIDSLDILYLRKYLLGAQNLESVCLEAADISKEKTVDSLDILYLRKNLLDSNKYKIEQ